MERKEIEKIAGIYFGIKPSKNISKKDEFEIVDLSDVEVDKDTIKKLNIKWENHIGSESQVARITPLDIMYYLNMKNNKDNYKKSIEILKELAKSNDLVLVRLEDRYLLINPKHRR